MANNKKFIDLRSTEVPDGLSDSNMTRVMYLSSICNTEFLSEREINHLINRLHSTKNETEKTDIKNKLLVSYQPLIFLLATKYATNGNQMDYVNEASIKFLEVIDSYVPGKSSLSTYMINCIVNYFAEIYPENSGTVYVPMKATQSKKLRKLVSVFVNENEREPTYEELEEICEENNIDINCLKDRYGDKEYIPFDALENDSDNGRKSVIAKYTEHVSVNEDYSYMDRDFLLSAIDYYCNSYVKKIKTECMRDKFIRNVEMVKEFYGVIDGEPKSYSWLSMHYRVTDEMARVAVKNTVKLLSSILPKEKLCA